MDISQNIKKFRKERGMTQKELADYLEVVPTTISAWELGRNKPLMDKVTIMANLFGVSTSDIVGDTFTEENINHIFSQLDDTRQVKVLNFAKKELVEQNKKIISYPEENEIHTFAAHRIDETQKATDEDRKRIHSILDDLDRKFDEKNKKR
ncbi:helix-turn-helix domain-containing protein [Enterococcus asini]|uniref:helix-turn-helix domain-containing protein n=1 Tax=Enterococcus asini TaxID=57732 RepID=UPI0022E89057|nr:helix-turn-helix transcriptional regulator [Enterococcus asini]